MVIKGFIFFGRLQEVFEQRKGIGKKLTFDSFMDTLKVFHINTPLEDKYKFLFLLMDNDNNGTLGFDDITNCLSLIYKSIVVVDDVTIKELAENVVS